MQRETESSSQSQDGEWEQDKELACECVSYLYFVRLYASCSCVMFAGLAVVVSARCWMLHEQSRSRSRLPACRGKEAYFPLSSSLMPWCAGGLCFNLNIC